MKKTILICLVIISAALAFNFSVTNTGNDGGKASSHTVEICFNPTCLPVPPDTKAHVVDAAGNDYGMCELKGGNCCKVYNVSDGVRHIHFTQNGSTFCDGPDFTLSADVIVNIPCHCP